MPRVPFAWIWLLLLAAPPALRAQATGETAMTRAVRSGVPVVVDGRDDDPVWRFAPVTSGFRQFYPQEDGRPTVETEFKVAYDDRNLYVFVRAYDPHPDSIMHAVTRRDVNSASDVIGITVDGFHDRRSGYEFVVNADGVKKDCAVYADTLFDWFWDGVWDAATRVDSLGWTAEFRIPFSQIRYADNSDHTFGLAVWRTSYRFAESSIWPLWRTSRGGLIHQLGDLTGITGIAAPRSMTFMPYASTANASRQSATGYTRSERTAVGGDARFVVAPNATVNATVNPDFGQVEADPSVLNLTTAETFYPEQRPFFREGGKLYEFDMGCTVVTCAGEGLFYSRRIGRAPQLLGLYGDAGSPAATPIAAAAKLTARSDHGLSANVLDAVTSRVGGTAGATLEPTTNYLVARAEQEAFGGKSALTVMGTAVNRSVDSTTSNLLRSDAFVAAISGRQRFGDSPYGVSASVVASRVDGSPRAITATETAPTHYYQRPDGALHVDSTRTSLVGSASEIAFGKYEGAVQFLGAWQRHSAAFEVNDVGFMERSDLQTLSGGVTAAMRTPRGVLRLVQTSLDAQRSWTTAWLDLGTTLSATSSVLFTNNWSFDIDLAAAQLGTALCDHCARGGPALRQEPAFTPGVTVSYDNRRPIVPTLSFTLNNGDGGRTHGLVIAPSIALHASPRFQVTLGGSFVQNHDNTQWFGNFPDSTAGTRYSFAALDQRTMSFTLRSSFAATPNFSIESYVAPFASTGTYAAIRQLSAEPRAESYDARFLSFTPPPTSAATGFDLRQLHANLVARWEYRPGSTLFVVWTHGRADADAPPAGLPLRDDYARLFAAHPDNTVLIKVSYWLNR